jgi:hypothetical protein
MHLFGMHLFFYEGGEEYDSGRDSGAGIDGMEDPL